MADYQGYILSELFLFGKLDKIIFSGNVTEGSRDLLVIDETTNKIVATGKSVEDGSYSMQITGSTHDAYSIVCMPDRWTDNENGAICSKIVGIAV